MILVPFSLDMGYDLLDQRQFFPGAYPYQRLSLVHTDTGLEIHRVDDALFAGIIDRSVPFHKRHGNNFLAGFDEDSFFPLFLQTGLDIQRPQSSSSETLPRENIPVAIGADGRILMTGPAVEVYEGKWPTQAEQKR